MQRKKVSSALLCDDIKTTGETLAVFETLLKESCGLERVEKFVIGHKKEEAAKAFMVAIQDPLDALELIDIDALTI